jgi:hypothetical protein
VLAVVLGLRAGLHHRLELGLLAAYGRPGLLSGALLLLRSLGAPTVAGLALALGLLLAAAALGLPLGPRLRH